MLIVCAVFITGVLIVRAGAYMQYGDRIRGRAFLLGRIAETVRLLTPYGFVFEW